MKHLAKNYIELVPTQQRTWCWIGIYSHKIYFDSDDRLEALYKGKEFDGKYMLYDIWETEEIMYTIDHPNSMTNL